MNETASCLVWRGQQPGYAEILYRFSYVAESHEAAMAQGCIPHASDIPYFHSDRMSDKLGHRQMTRITRSARIDPNTW